MLHNNNDTKHVSNRTNRTNQASKRRSSTYLPILRQLTVSESKPLFQRHLIKLRNESCLGLIVIQSSSRARATPSVNVQRELTNNDGNQDEPHRHDVFFELHASAGVAATN